MKYHGGADLKTITQENLEALEEGHRQSRTPRRERAEELRYSLRWSRSNRFLTTIRRPNWISSNRELPSSARKWCLRRIGVMVQGGGGTGAYRCGPVRTEEPIIQFVYDEKDTLWDKINKIAKKDLTGRAM